MRTPFSSILVYVFEFIADIIRKCFNLTDKNSKEENMKIGFGLWLTLCFFICVWFMTSFTRGRRQFQSNLNVIEDGLKRMKDEMDLKEDEQEQYTGPEDLERFLEQLEKEEEERERMMNKNKAKSNPAAQEKEVPKTEDAIKETVKETVDGKVEEVEDENKKNV